MSSLFCKEYSKDCFVILLTLYTMNSSLAEIAAKTGKQPRIIFCLNDQANMACFMCLRGV